MTLISAFSFWSTFRISSNSEYTNFFNFFLTTGTTRGDVPQIKLFEDVICVLFPFFIFQFVFGKTVDNDYSECSYYVLTRQKSKTICYLKNVFRLFCLSFISNLIYYCVGFLTLVAAGATVTSPMASFVLTIEMMITSTLFIFVFSLIISVVSIIFNNVIGLFSVNLFLVLSAVIVAFFDPVKGTLIFKYNIISNITPRLHMLPKLPLEENPSLMFIEGLTHEFSIIYFMVLAVIVIIIGAITVNKKDVF